ncbi:M35 family metallo-endopeptidase [Yoonia sp.]|uniref:M35 family metallo-endopeptidase n=1 Tax=Yoonia sp. TaxID=2212373 RepID=UPI0035C7C46F
MLRFLLTILFATFVAGPAVAQRVTSCSAAETAAIETALQDAKALTLRAAVSIRPTQTYVQWFGPYTRGNAQDVRAAFKSVLTTIKTGAVRARCEPLSEETCASGGYAFVYPTMPYMVHICPRFFELPTAIALSQGQSQDEYGTRGGTFIHELSHFGLAADTDDHCYGRSACGEMAQEVPRLAVKNADSYQYLAEDLALSVQVGLAGKPPPAARPVQD